MRDENRERARDEDRSARVPARRRDETRRDETRRQQAWHGHQSPSPRHRSGVLMAPKPGPALPCAPLEPAPSPPGRERDAMRCGSGAPRCVLLTPCISPSCGTSAPQEVLTALRSRIECASGGRPPSDERRRGGVTRSGGRGALPSVTACLAEGASHGRGGQRGKSGTHEVC